MKKRFRVLTAFLLAALCVLVPLPAKASGESPYPSFTYDRWGNTVPAPNGYLPSRSIGGAEIGCGNFNAAQDLFYCKARGEIYIADSGNARIIVTDESFGLKKVVTELENPGGEPYVLKNPYGVFAQADGTVYICDTGNQQVVEADADGKLVRILPTPESPLIPDGFNYLPTKVAVDAAGRIYVLSRGVYQGLIYLEADGSFIRFFGPNNVEMTFARRIMKLWKSILSDKAAASMQSFNPIEYSNIYLDEEGYIYATAAASENGASRLTRLNPVGIDTLPFSLSSTTTTLFNDVVVHNGVITVMDTNYGTISQYSLTGISNLPVFSMGSLGNQVGLFQKPSSIEEIGGNLYILDAEKNTVTEFVRTDFGNEVLEALRFFSEGLYQESAEHWEKVIRMDTNYLLAYGGMGLAFYQQRDFEKAMYYFRLGNDRSGYSDAFKEHSLELVRSSFGGIVWGIAAAAACALVIPKLIRKRKEARS